METGRRTARRVILSGVSGILLGITAAASGVAVSISKFGEAADTPGFGGSDIFAQALSSAMGYITIGGFVALGGLIALVIGIVIAVLDNQQDLSSK